MATCHNGQAQMGKDNFNCPSSLADVNLTTIHHMAMTFFTNIGKKPNILP